MQTLSIASYMNSRKSTPNAMDAFALRGFVLSLVDNLSSIEPRAVPWNTREEGIVMIEEILLEGRACGFETREGFEELCKTVFTFKIKLPFSKQARQALSRPGLTELQRVESLRLCLVNLNQDGSVPKLPHASSN